MREIIFFKAILSVAFASKVQKNDLPYCPEGIGVYSKPNSDPSNTQLYMSKLWTWPKKGKTRTPQDMDGTLTLIFAILETS